eukprot:CAMPEP_0183769730 /NCGR_PEP_ID=MMETSP0739-20130205/22851_1 /TAXON_ID=385413 /ORGANISM="Thalassiosira miniscula, Strain CCMP1093" /LENGTH=220 /DNA_ID=CAMNT_0026009417 /DNA_START=143 /DNA_END=805 /DNA_ORIENTATION=-
MGTSIAEYDSDEEIGHWIWKNTRGKPTQETKTKSANETASTMNERQRPVLVVKTNNAYGASGEEAGLQNQIILPTNRTKPKDRASRRQGTERKHKRKQCIREGCTNNAQKGGVCMRHGAKRKQCSHDGCSSSAQIGGVCARHGGKPKQCSYEGCTNNSRRGGVCARHGAERKQCSHEGCSSTAQIGGVCMRHGAKRKRCSHVGCTNVSLKGGVCRRHGAK